MVYLWARAKEGACDGIGLAERAGVTRIRLAGIFQVAKKTCTSTNAKRREGPNGQSMQPIQRQTKMEAKPKAKKRTNHRCHHSNGSEKGKRRERVGARERKKKAEINKIYKTRARTLKNAQKAQNKAPCNAVLTYRFFLAGIRSSMNRVGRDKWRRSNKAQSCSRLC